MAKKKSKKKTPSRKTRSTSSKTRRITKKTSQVAANQVAAQLPCQRSQDRLSEALVGNFDARFHKGLSHADDGTVDETSFQNFVSALQSLDQTGSPNDFTALGKPSGHRNWVNPLCGWAVDTELSDTCFHAIPAPPAFDTVETAAEAVELYWMSLLRDVPFAYWSSDGNVQDAAEELNELPLFINRNGDVNKAPNTSNNRYISRPVDFQSIFRGGELFSDGGTNDDNLATHENVGPFISQFLSQEIPYGVLRIPQKIIWGRANTNYLTTVSDWLAVQNGESRNATENLVGESDEDADQRRHISTMRDLATYVHFDQLYEAYLNAALILVQGGYPLDSGNPYGGICPAFCGIGSSETGSTSGLGNNQEGFGVFGGAHILSLVTEVATRALKSVWRQKWTHLRLRPEAYGGLVALRPDVLGAVGCEFTERTAYKRSKARYSSGLLPMAFPEGSPMHPAYGAGHATVAGACVTVLKSFFDEQALVRNSVIASADGTALQAYSETDQGQMTVGLELDKLASNIAIGRNMAGVHWRSDYTQSILLGQRVAVDMLYRQCRDYIEDYSFNFTSFGGGKVKICHTGVSYQSPGSSSYTTVVAGDQHGHPDRIARSNDQQIAEALLQII